MKSPHDRFHPSTAYCAIWPPRKNTSSSINIRTSMPPFRRRIPFTTSSACSTARRNGLALHPTLGTKFQKVILTFIDTKKIQLKTCCRYPNGNGASLGITTGVGAGSPPYTPLPGATSPDQTPLCHQISSNDGSYNHKKGKSIYHNIYFSIYSVSLLLLVKNEKKWKKFFIFHLKKKTFLVLMPYGVFCV